ncbi:MAG: hypothetical protein RLZZ627_2115 [Pseudomonadota bacterium]|jgi:D-glycerate 3-kinase
MQIPQSLWAHLSGASLGLGSWIASQHQGVPLLVGINGAQGSGKSTTAELLAITLRQVHGLKTIQCSIDDFYLTHNERVQLARDIHPLLITRGVPGTHDLKLLNDTLNRLMTQGSSETTRVPRFSKALDDRLPINDWETFRGRADVVILEGWCVGTPPQPKTRLKGAINTLEAEEDADGAWRKYVNDALCEGYRSLFDRLDLLVFLKIPDFSAVIEWRGLQEEKLAEKAAHLIGSNIMDAKAIQRFVMHFERLTRWNLETLPLVADLTLEIDRAHRFVKVSG